jgi:hypothetical protein
VGFLALADIATSIFTKASSSGKTYVFYGAIAKDGAAVTDDRPLRPFAEQPRQQWRALLSTALFLSMNAEIRHEVRLAVVQNVSLVQIGRDDLRVGALT